MNFNQTFVLSTNVQLRDKIHICKTLTWLSKDLGDAEKVTAKALLNSVRDRTPLRNMMAHDLFWPSSESDGVEFNVIKAKGELSFPDTVWTISKFEEEIAINNDHGERLDALYQRMGPARITREFLASLSPNGLGISIGGGLTTGITAGPGGLTGADRRDPRPQAGLGSASDPSNPQPPAQTDPASRE